MVTHMLVPAQGRLQSWGASEGRFWAVSLAVMVSNANVVSVKLQLSVPHWRACSLPKRHSWLFQASIRENVNTTLDSRGYTALIS